MSGTCIREDGTPFNRVAGDFTVVFWMKTGMTSIAGGQWWQGNGLIDAESSGHTRAWSVGLLNDKVALGTDNSTDLTIQSAVAVIDDEWHFGLRSRRAGRHGGEVNGPSPGVHGKTSAGRRVSPVVVCQLASAPSRGEFHGCRRG